MQSSASGTEMTITDYHTDAFFGDPYVRPKFMNCPTNVEAERTAEFKEDQLGVVPGKRALRTYSYSWVNMNSYFNARKFIYHGQNISNAPAIWEETTREEKVRK